MLPGLLQVGLVAGDFDGFAGFEGVRRLFGSVDDGAEQGLLGGQAIKGGRGDRRGGGDECDHKKVMGLYIRGSYKAFLGTRFPNQLIISEIKSYYTFSTPGGGRSGTDTLGLV